MSVVIGLSALCGNYLCGHVATVPHLSILACAEALLAAGGFALNDILDLDRDRFVFWKPLARGELPITHARILAFALLSAGLLFCYSLGRLTVLIGVLQLLAIWAYSWVKRRSGVFANLTTATLCASAFLLGASVSQRLGYAWIPAMLTLQFVFARELAKDVLDMEQDREAGIPTAPLKYGLGQTAWSVVALVLLTSATSLLPAVTSHLGAGYPRLISLVDIVLLIASLNFWKNRAHNGVRSFLVASAAMFPVALLAYFV